MSRDRRILDLKRVRAKVVRVTASWHETWPKDSKAIGRYVNHGLQICSCYMCGNPRRHHKGAATMQERRAAESAKTQ